MDYFNYTNSASRSNSHLTVLSELSEEDWQLLLEYTDNIQFKAGDILLETGDTDDGVYILVSGSVEVVKKNRFGQERSLAEITEGNSGDSLLIS